jgi:hypothetical protein
MNPFGLILILVTALLIGLLLIRSRKVIFFTACAFAFIPFDYVDRFFFELPSAIRWLPFMVITTMAAVSFFLPYEKKLKIPFPLILVYGLILMLSVVSLLYNHSSIKALLVAQRGYLLIFSFLIIMRNVYGKFSKEDLYSLLVWVGIVHFPIALFQRVVFVSLLKIESGDMVSGLLPVDGFYLFFQCICILITLHYWLRGKRIIRQISPEITLLLLMGSIAVGANKAGFIFLAGTFGLVMLRTPLTLIMKQMRKIVAAGIAVSLAFVTFTFVYNQEFAQGEQDSYTKLLTDPEFFIRYNFAGSSERSQFTPSGRLKRGAAISFAWKNIEHKTSTMLIGLGPGATAESNMDGASGSLAAKYPNYYINRVSMAMYLGDLGLVGLGLHVLFLLCLWWCHPRDQQADSSSFSVDRCIREGFIILTLVYYTYENLYFEPMFGLLIAVLVYPYVRADRTEDEQEHVVVRKAASLV